MDWISSKQKLFESSISEQTIGIFAIWILFFIFELVIIPLKFLKYSKCL